MAVYQHEATVPVSEGLDRGSGRARPWGPSPLGSARVTSLIGWPRLDAPE